MKNLKQLVLPCYKLEIAMSVEAWYFLHGSTDGIWGIGRKAVSRLLEDFSERGLIRVDSTPVTSIIDMMCVKSWMIAGRLIENPAYRQTVKAYEGVRIFLFNGQRLETLRRSSTRKKNTKAVIEEEPNPMSLQQQPILESENLTVA